MKISTLKLSLVIVFLTIFSSSGFSQSTIASLSPGGDPLDASINVTNYVAQAPNSTLPSAEAKQDNNSPANLIVKKSDKKVTETFSYKTAINSDNEKLQTTMVYPKVAIK